MDYSAFTLTLVPALISCAAAVVSFYAAKKPASIELHQTVDEMVTLIEKMMKEQRKVKMSNVRAAVKDTGDTTSNLASVETSVQPRQLSKQELRALVRQKVR
jgi:hypothetical protein